MAKIAMIGTGISGLSAAWLLHRRHDITVYEKNVRPGGHSRTLTVRHGDRAIAVDTGFIVFNERNYPNLTQLFRRLGVTIKNSDMSFGLDRGRWQAGMGRARTWMRFSASAAICCGRVSSNWFMTSPASISAWKRKSRAPELTLGGLLAKMGMGDWFLRHYLLPMAGAIWSCPPCQMMDFPARTFVRFFVNHHLLSVSGQPQWLTLEGGSQDLCRALGGAACRPAAHRLRRGAGDARWRWRDGSGPGGQQRTL